MAVTQISRIQVRRGRKLSPSGIPQLASGEFAWAIDSQELFIGNGSVAEGAPYVGNTKILTEHDNILSLVSAYRFKEGDPTVTRSVQRSLQSKLDEYVSVIDFGAVGDGIYDNSDAFEQAFLDLYSDRGIGNNVYRKVLFVPSGRYVFSRTIRIPSNVILIGESTETTTLQFLNTAGIKFSIINPSSSSLFIEDPALFDSELPQNIYISNLTISGSGTSNGINITASRFVLFEKVKFSGNYVRSDVVEWISTVAYLTGDRVRHNGLIYQAVTDIAVDAGANINDLEYWSLVREPAVFWSNSSEALKTDVIKFKNCKFESHVTSLRCDQTNAPSSLTTDVFVESCEFENLDSVVFVDGVINQSNNWRFIQCDFKNTSSSAIVVNYGKNMLLKECNFENAGVDENGDYVVPEVIFKQSQNNLLVDCTSDRQSNLGITNLGSAPFVPEVHGADKVTFLNRNYAAIREVYSAEPIAIFSSLNDYIEVDYHIKLNMGDIRIGKLKIRVDNNSRSLTLIDDYSYVSPPGRAWGIQVDRNLEITRVEFGRLYEGAQISGDNITLGTKITFVPTSPGTINPITQASPLYNVDRLPIVSPTAGTPQPITFTRDTARNIVFEAELVNNDDSSDVETIVLKYKQLYGQPPESLNQNGRSSPGVISFDVSYGTLSV